MVFQSTCNFQVGKEVEVCCNSDGFLGSYWEATIVDAKMGTNSYMVEYKNFVEEDDESIPLQETIAVTDVRPLAPEIKPSRYTSTLEGYMVDVKHEGGWWAGTVSRKIDSEHYFIFFETLGKENAYPISKMRYHMEWLSGQWIPSNKRAIVSSKKRFAPVYDFLSKRNVNMEELDRFSISDVVVRG